MTVGDPGAALRDIAAELTRLGKAFAIVGGFGVSVRAEVRFTRDVDVAVDVPDDPAVEALVGELRSKRYAVIAIVEHDEAKRIATVRLRSPSSVTVDLLTASSGIEREIVARAGSVDIEDIGAVPVATAEDLLVMKVLAMDGRRPQDRLDAIRLIELNPLLDRARVREGLQLIEQRGFHRKQDLMAKLEEVVGLANGVTTGP